ncbi:MAG TPA: methionine--tRNA ligase [Candidatus Eremiobacteraeota bacterium]|nr:MAG: Methionine--tRNA ligase [bacterium ADurb.Bin363]HPZ07831.1 methionine--tRNA ligase [Candidatus Eremiobacteraeota bacterium]
MNKEKYLVTSALPYANGPIHFGHIAGAYLPADIYVRFQRMRGVDIIYICGTDEHGVAITISAEKEGATPQAHVDKYYKVIKNIFDNFNIKFDNFSRTSLSHHYKLSQEFFTDLYNNGYVKASLTNQLYCKKCNRFLADRYVMGICPACGHSAARGDECGKCGKWLEAMELVEPRCKVCMEKPEVRETKHWFLQLQLLSKKLMNWLNSHKEWKENVKNFIGNMIKGGLEERPITRDLDWGVPVPLTDAEGKVLYVWFDAPIGYISSTMEWAEKQGKPDMWKDYWYDKNCRLVHFIGKDNISFHCVVWPAMIIGQNKPLILPWNVPANEFYNLEGKQFSKSEGWYISLDDFFQKYQTDVIRYTIISNSPENRDTEFTWKDFQSRNNDHLADTYGNLVHRIFTFIEKYFDGLIPKPENLSSVDLAMLEEIKKTPEIIEECLLNFKNRQASHELMELARKGNRYYNDKAPWKSRKENLQDCGNTMYVCAKLLQVLSVLTYPFMPSTAEKLWSMLGYSSKIQEERWLKIAEKELKAGQKLDKPEILFAKIDDKIIEGEIERMKEEFAKIQKEKEKPPVEYTPLKETISYDDFARLDFRVARVISAEAVPKSKKLIKLIIDLGFEERQIVAGIALHYKPEELIGKHLIVVANLAPTKLMNVESNGMLLASTIGDKLTILTIDKAIDPGALVS